MDPPLPKHQASVETQIPIEMFWQSDTPANTQYGLGPFVSRTHSSVGILLPSSGLRNMDAIVSMRTELWVMEGGRLLKGENSASDGTIGLVSWNSLVRCFLLQRTPREVVEHANTGLIRERRRNCVYFRGPAWQNVSTRFLSVDATPMMKTLQRRCLKVRARTECLTQEKY